MKIALSVQKGDVKCTVEPICRSVAPCLKKNQIDDPGSIFSHFFRPGTKDYSLLRSGQA